MTRRKPSIGGSAPIGGPTTIQQLEYRLATAQEELRKSEVKRVEQRIKFEEMMRKSEAMRNRQVDSINRLLKDGSHSAEMTNLHLDLAAADVRHQDDQTEIARLKSESDPRNALLDALKEKE